MIVKQDTKQEFKPVTITLETFAEFQALTKIVQTYQEDTHYEFSVKLYNDLDNIHQL